MDIKGNWYTFRGRRPGQNSVCSLLKKGLFTNMKKRAQLFLLEQTSLQKVDETILTELFLLKVKFLLKYIFLQFGKISLTACLVLARG